jgi:hypothetical protein
MHLSTSVLIACGALAAVVLPSAQPSNLLMNTGKMPPVAQGTVITVTSSTDGLNGDTSTVARLIAHPGPDGLSLREAIVATNEDPGSYTIEFSPDLAGAVIEPETSLEPLSSGGVVINGDIDGDGEPDVAIRGPSADEHAFGLRISSSDNTLYALELIDWDQGVSLSPPEPATGTIYGNNTLANLVIRDVRLGILLNSPGGGEDNVRDTQNRWIDTQIVGNRIEAFAGITLGLAFTVGDVVDGIVIERNEIALVDVGDGPPSEGAISLAAGFWDGSTGNQFTDVVIADNTITGAASGITLNAGAVGASGNMISGVRISNNSIDVDTTALLVFAGDASTAWADPNHTPVAYPDHNTIRDIEILDNMIKWTFDIGILITAGQPASHITVENVRIAGNDLDGSGAQAIGIHTGAGSDFPEDIRRSIGNQLSAVRIEDNVIRFDSQPQPQPPGAIVLMTGEAMSDGHQMRDVRISGNHIESSTTGILLFGGGENTTGNQLTGVELTCNRIAGTPEILMIGGQGEHAIGNLIGDVVLSGNLTGDVLNEVSSQPNTQGATDNDVEWTVIDQIPAGCPITAPNSPVVQSEMTTSSATGSTAPTKPTTGSTEPTQASMDSSAEPSSSSDRGVGRASAWVWTVGAIGAVGVITSSLLLVRRRASRRRET